MRALRRLIGAGLILGVAACGAAEAPPEPARSIASTDFALAACGPQDQRRACVLVVAGGKRVLLGAPAGVAASLSDDDLAQIDAVMLFSLHADDIEGLDEVRNATWRAGRMRPLPVAGPPETERIVAAVNAAFEVSDALIVADGGAASPFDAAPLVVRTPAAGAAAREWTALDTGDLRVVATAAGPLRRMFRIEYEGVSALIAPCEVAAELLPSPAAVDFTLACADAQRDAAWPLAGPPIFITNVDLNASG